MIIPAHATSEQSRHFSQLAQIASDDLFTDLFGSRATDVLKFMFLQASNDFSHRYTCFLMAAEDIAGMIHAYPAEQASSQQTRTVWLLLRQARWQIPRFLAVAILLGDILSFPGSNLERGDFYIAFLSLYPQYHGRGHSRMLLNHAQSQAAAHGLSRLVLDVDERNHIAISAYHGAGFQQIAASKKIRFQSQRWGLLRLAKPVAPTSGAG